MSMTHFAPETLGVGQKPLATASLFSYIFFSVEGRGIGVPLQRVKVGCVRCRCVEVHLLGQN